MRVGKDKLYQFLFNYPQLFQECEHVFEYLNQLITMTILTLVSKTIINLKILSNSST